MDKRRPSHRFSDRKWASRICRTRRRRRHPKTLQLHAGPKGPAVHEEGLEPKTTPQAEAQAEVPTSHERSECTRRDLNPHTLRCRNLNPVRLPIPPLVLGRAQHSTPWRDASAASSAKFVSWFAAAGQSGALIALELLEQPAVHAEKVGQNREQEGLKADQEQHR